MSATQPPPTPAAAIQRAEAAEARVAELEAVRQDLLGKIVGWQDGARADHARIAELEARVKSTVLVMGQGHVERVTELEAQNARLREALEELKRNTVELVLPNAKCLTLDLGQLALWDACVKQVDEALADGKDAPS